MITPSKLEYLSPEWREAAQAAKSTAVCSGGGYSAPMHVWEYDGAVFSEPCTCNRKDRFERHLLRMGGQLQDKSFANFETERQPDAVRACRCLLDTWEVGAVMQGTEGTGKSHLARAMVRAALEEKRGIANFVSAIELSDLFRRSQGFEESGESARQELNTLKCSKLLVVDDLGSQRHTKSEVWEEQFQAFLDTFPGLLVVTTNLQGRDLISTIGAKSYDRLCARCVPIELKGKSYRKAHMPRLPIQDLGGGERGAA